VNVAVKYEAPAARAELTLPRRYPGLE